MGMTKKVLDRFEAVIIKAEDAKAELAIVKAERDHAQQLCGERQIALAKLQTENDNLRKLYDRIDADNTNLRQQTADFRKEAGGKERKFKVLYESAAALCSASGEKGKRGLVENLRAALKDAHDCLDWIPF